MKKIFILIVKFYRRFLSPLKKPCCRFYPTCSEYSLQAFEKYGAIKGLRLSFKRVMKCHPFGSSGYDPLE